MTLLSGVLIAAPVVNGMGQKAGEDLYAALKRGLHSLIASAEGEPTLAPTAPRLVQPEDAGTDEDRGVCEEDATKEPPAR